MSVCTFVMQPLNKAVPAPPTTLHRIADLLHHILFGKQNQLYTLGTLQHSWSIWKWHTLPKIKHESKKTFEHLLFICRGTVSHWEDSRDLENANPRAAEEQKVQQRDWNATFGFEKKIWIQWFKSFSSVLLWFFNLTSHRKRLSMYSLHWRVCAQNQDKEADLQGHRVNIIARNATMFGKMRNTN